MTSFWNAGNHTVQFYESEPFVHHTIAEFFTRGVHPGDPLILVSRGRTFAAVAEKLAAGPYSTGIDTTARIQFIDAEAALSQIMSGETPGDTAERLFTHMLSQAQPSHPQGTVRLYGEVVDILCQHGLHATALQLEGVATTLLDQDPRLSILCGYALERFKSDTDAVRLRAVCRKHTHVVQAESFGPALLGHDFQSVMLQNNPFEHMLARQPPPRIATSAGTSRARTVYLIDDNPSLRRAIGRLLTLSNWSVRTFNSAEEFLAELDELSSGYLVLDVQLPGMSGLDLISRLTNAGLSWPVIVISGLLDKKTADEALRLGARAYLRKPFNSQALLDEIARAFQ